MAYQTGTATDPADLLDKLRLFALANGFTVNFWGDRTAGTAPRKSLHLTKGVLVGAFQSDSGLGTSTNPGMYLLTHCHDAYAGGGGTEAQANRSASTIANGMGGPYQAYHFFCDNGGAAMPYLYVVVETAAGTFKHFGIGRLNMLGTMTTGCFNYGASWSYDPTYISSAAQSRHAWPFDNTENTYRQYPGTQVRADSDTISPRWLDPGLSVPTLFCGVRAATAMCYGPHYSSASKRTGRTILVPCIVAGFRASSLFSVLGAPPNIRWVKLDYLDPGQTLTIGTDVWKVFPVIRKNGSAGQPNSDTSGYAFLVN